MGGDPTGHAGRHQKWGESEIGAERGYRYERARGGGERAETPQHKDREVGDAAPLRAWCGGDGHKLGPSVHVK